MAGYLYEVPLRFVSDEELSENKLKQIRKDAQNDLVVLMDDEVTVVREDQDQLILPEPHHHHSTPRSQCQHCEIKAYDQMHVQVPE